MSEQSDLDEICGMLFLCCDTLNFKKVKVGNKSQIEVRPDPSFFSSDEVLCIIDVLKTYPSLSFYIIGEGIKPVIVIYEVS